MSDQELFEVARELILDVMESLSDKGAHNTPMALCAMMVPILHCAHDCSPSASEVRRLINASNKLARELSEGGEA
jgi:hypothetical protein